jgi:CubicO group peptidase (beta-lactamase class C family)
MLKFLQVSAVLLLIVAGLVTLDYQYWQSQIDIPETGTVRETAQALIDQGYIPGIAYSLIKQGQIVEVAALGQADMETGEALRPDTLFEAASLTKPIIAEVARRLYLEGLYELDEPISQTISNPRTVDDEHWSLVTPRQLLAHRAGYPNWSGDSLDPNRDGKLETEFVPGSDFQYSGEGYGLLLAFLEARSQRSMADLSAELFAELGMSHSTLVAADFPGQYARGHWIVEPARPARRTAQVVAAYSLFTTPEDYARFMLHVMAQFGEDELFAVPAASFQTFAQGDELAWALGWGVLIREDAMLHYQWGDNGPFKALAMFDLESGTGLVYFCNGSLGTTFADELAQPVFGDISSASDWFTYSFVEYLRPKLGI